MAALTPPWLGVHGVRCVSPLWSACEVLPKIVRSRVFSEIELSERRRDSVLGCRSWLLNASRLSTVESSEKSAPPFKSAKQTPGVCAATDVAGEPLHSASSAHFVTLQPRIYPTTHSGAIVESSSYRKLTTKWRRLRFTTSSTTQLRTIRSRRTASRWPSPATPLSSSTPRSAAPSSSRTN